MRRSLLLSTLAALAGALVFGAGFARADVPPAVPVPPGLGGAAPAVPVPDWCASASADVTLDLGYGLSEVSTESGGFDYTASVPCRRFVVDIDVTPFSSPPQGPYDHWAKTFNLFGGMMNDYTYRWSRTGSECEQWVEDVSFYAKPLVLGATFTRIGGGRLHGVWAFDGYAAGNGYYVCEIRPNDGYVQPPLNIQPPPYGTMRFRVAASLKLGAAVQPVEAGAAHTFTGYLPHQ